MVLRGMPAAVPGNGNSLSVAIAGKLSLVNELRVRTCIEMVANKEMYTQMHQRTGLPLVSPDYSVAMKECAVDSAYSSAWIIAAASTVLKTRVISVYPPVNGLVDKTTCDPSQSISSNAREHNEKTYFCQLNKRLPTFPFENVVP